MPCQISLMALLLGVFCLMLPVGGISSLTCTHFAPEKFALLGWNSCFPNRTNKPKYSLDDTPLFEHNQKNGTRVATAYHRGRKNLFPRMLI